MASQAKFKDGVAGLKGDAEQVAKELSDLTKSIGDLTKDESHRLSEELIKKFEDQLDVISARMADLRKQVNKGAAKVDTNIKENPYMYILGAIGVGFLLGKILPSHKQS